MLRWSILSPSGQLVSPCSIFLDCDLFKKNIPGFYVQGGILIFNGFNDVVVDYVVDKSNIVLMFEERGIGTEDTFPFLFFLYVNIKI